MLKSHKFILTLVLSAPFIWSTEALALSGANHSGTLLLDA
jgi:hypothetical protein